MVRPRPIQGESNIDYLGESAGSLPPPHDSFRDAGQAINDFWSMSGSSIYRYHVEPRVKLHSPREESFPIPLKYIDVSRTTHTNLDVKQEKRIDDYWNIDGSRDLSDLWTGFTQFTLLEEKAPDGLFDRINLDPKIQIKYIDTKNQLADILTKGNFTRDEWNHLLTLFNISHFSSTACIAAMAKRAQQGSGEERVTAKSRPMMNLTARMPSVVSSSTSSNPGRTSYGYQDP